MSLLSAAAFPGDTTGLWAAVSRGIQGIERPQEFQADATPEIKKTCGQSGVTTLVGGKRIFLSPNQGLPGAWATRHQEKDNDDDSSDNLVPFIPRPHAFNCTPSFIHYPTK